MLARLHKTLRCQSLGILKKHLQSGHIDSIDEVTISLALKDWRENPLLGSQIHALAVPSGFVSNTTICNSLMSLYCNSEQFSKALFIFETLTDPDTVSWNTILSGFRRCEDAFSFVRRMNLNEAPFDAVTYSTIISLCSTQECFLAGFQLHTCVVKAGLDRDVIVQNVLVTMYCRWGCLIEARKVFDEMPNRDLVSWNAILSGYAQEGTYGSEALGMFEEMVRVQVLPDHVSFTSGVSACGQERNKEMARQIHNLCVKRGHEKHVSICNVLISTYFKCEEVEDANLVFQNMSECDVISWTSIISIRQKDAISLFNAMRIDGIYPNCVTFVSIFHAITIENSVGEGMMVHGLCIKTSFSSKPDVSNSLISMYAHFKSIDDSLKVFETLDNVENVSSWNALISGYVQNGFHLKAIQTFFSSLSEFTPNQYTLGSVLTAIGAAMDVSIKHGQRCHSHIIKHGLNTDPIVSSALLNMYAKRGSIQESQSVFSEAPQRSQFAWTAIISAYARHGDHESVMNWFWEMEKQGGVKPDWITFLSVLVACGRKGMVDLGLHMFDLMVKDYKIEPRPEHYSCMVDMLGRAGRLEEAEELLRSIRGGPTISMLHCLLGACRVHGNVEMGEKLAHVLTSMEPMESGSYVLMSNLYAENEQWEKAAQVRQGMRQNGVKKEVGFSWVDVGDANAPLHLHGFSTWDTSHPRTQEIWQMAECLGSGITSVRKREHLDS